MDKKKIMAITAVIILVIAVVGALFFSGGNGNADEAQVRAAFNSFSAARAGGNGDVVSALVSKGFSDAGMVHATAVEEFGIAVDGYSAEVSGINMRENQAEISYTRKLLKDGKVAHIPVINEIWVKEPDGKWRLFRLSAADNTRIAKARRQRQLEEERQLEQQLVVGMKPDEVEKIRFYSPKGKRDPFKSLIVEFRPTEIGRSAVEERCDSGRPREFLEGFDLLSLKLVGILQRDKYFAMMEVPNGKGYTVKMGMYVGRHCGRVIKITREGLTVAEKLFNRRFGFKVVKRELKLKKEESFL